MSDTNAAAVRLELLDLLWAQVWDNKDGSLGDPKDSYRTLRASLAQQAPMVESVVAVDAHGIHRQLEIEHASQAPNGLRIFVNSIAQQGEACWIDRRDLADLQSGHRQRMPVFASMQDEDDVALFTHPAAVDEVQEGRVDVALAAYNRADYQWVQRDPDDRDEPRHRFAMRAALTAALLPATSEGENNG